MKILDKRRLPTPINTTVNKIMQLIEKYSGDEFDDYSLRVEKDNSNKIEIVISSNRNLNIISSYAKILRNHDMKVSNILTLHAGWKQIRVEIN